MSSSPDFTARMARRLAPLLMADERVLAGGQRHWLSYLGAIYFCLLALTSLGLSFSLAPPLEGAPDASRVLLLFVSAVLGLLGILSFIGTAIANWTMVMAVTSRRVFMRTGLIARDIVDIPLVKVDIVNLEQGVIDRIFGCGTVLVRTMGEVTTRFPAIANPTAMRNAIVQAMDVAAQRGAAPASQNVSKDQ